VQGGSKSSASTGGGGGGGGGNKEGRGKVEPKREEEKVRTFYPSYINNIFETLSYQHYPSKINNIFERLS